MSKGLVDQLEQLRSSVAKMADEMESHAKAKVQTNVNSVSFGLKPTI